MKLVKEYLYEMYTGSSGMHDSVVTSAQDFAERAKNGQWKHDKKERKALKSFIKDMNKKYGESNHS